MSDQSGTKILRLETLLVMKVADSVMELKIEIVLFARTIFHS